MCAPRERPWSPWECALWATKEEDRWDHCEKMQLGPLWTTGKRSLCDPWDIAHRYSVTWCFWDREGAPGLGLQRERTAGIEKGRWGFWDREGAPVVGHHTLVTTTPRMEGHRQQCHREQTLDRHCFLSRGPVNADAFCLAEPNVGLVVFHKRCMAKWVFSKNV